MSKQLIVNADDYGRTAGVSTGIRLAHQQGIVTSTTVMMNMPGIESALEKAQRDCPRLGLGVHLVLTSGQPLSPSSMVPSLTSDGMHFPSADGFMSLLPNINVEQVRLEWNAQVQKFIDLTGNVPDHLDSHHHTSYFTFDLFKSMLELAAELDCAIRPPLAETGGGMPLDLPPELSGQAMEFIPSLLEEFKPRHPENFYSSFYDESATPDTLLKILSNLPEGRSEVMCHPGYADTGLLTGSSYNRQRENELSILTSLEARSEVTSLGIRLINFSELSKGQN